MVVAGVDGVATHLDLTYGDAIPGQRLATVVGDAYLDTGDDAALAGEDLVEGGVVNLIVGMERAAQRRQGACFGHPPCMNDAHPYVARVCVLQRWWHGRAAADDAVERANAVPCAFQ